jgi:hypothetical protein
MKSIKPKLLDDKILFSCKSNSHLIEKHTLYSEILTDVKSKNLSIPLLRRGALSRLVGSSGSG